MYHGIPVDRAELRRTVMARPGAMHVQGRRTRQHPRAKQSVSLVDLQNPNLEKKLKTMARRGGGAAVHENRQ
jgi:hypothetical protein